MNNANDCQVRLIVEFVKAAAQLKEKLGPESAPLVMYQIQEKLVRNGTKKATVETIKIHGSFDMMTVASALDELRESFSFNFSEWSVKNRFYDTADENGIRMIREVIFIRRKIEDVEAD